MLASLFSCPISFARSLWQKVLQAHKTEATQAAAKQQALALVESINEMMCLPQATTQSPEGLDDLKQKLDKLKCVKELRSMLGLPHPELESAIQSLDTWIGQAVCSDSLYQGALNMLRDWASQCYNMEEGAGISSRASAFSTSFPAFPGNVDQVFMLRCCSAFLSRPGRHILSQVNEKSLKISFFIFIGGLIIGCFRLAICHEYNTSNIYIYILYIYIINKYIYII